MKITRPNGRVKNQVDLKGIEPSEDMPTMPCLRGFLSLVSIFVSIFYSEQRVDGFDDI